MQAKKKSSKVVSAHAGQKVDLKEALESLAAKRSGGSINIRGLEFQLLYASQLLLTTFKNDSTDTIRLEGIEDIDVYNYKSNEFIQAKTSQNKVDANDFWGLGVLQNFDKVFRDLPDSKFRLVHNCEFAKGKLDELLTKTFSKEGLEFWNSKLSSAGGKADVKDLVARITFEKVDLKSLETRIVHSFIEDYNINSGSVIPFARSLFYHVFKWSKDRATISSSDLIKLIQLVKDSFSSFPQNPALLNKWIEQVTFDITNDSDDLSYFDGKAARPVDIAKGLPVKRETWENEITKSINQFDVTVVMSSSGQGKSTLAWTTAFAAFKRSQTIYKLVRCSSYEEAVASIEFIESRLLIGQQLLIVLDGLNQETSDWHRVAEKLRDQPVQIIITSREEDWVRYGSNISGIELNIVNIRLSIDEAKGIFNGLRNNKRVHSSIGAWQPSWEKVKDRGLLIEYVYLLTQGEMIEERLIQQIRAINNERDSPAKLEILRLISLSDVLSLRIRTQKITDYVMSKFVLSTDRNEIYRQLEKEYYLKFGEKYVEGLHPVRSEHLVRILHSNTEINSSLLELLKILDEDLVYEFFISAPFKFELDDEFYSKVAGIMSTRSFAQMVYVVDGLMHFEPYRYWLQNKGVYDDIFHRGGLELAVYDSVPINSPNTLEALAKSMEPVAGNLTYIANRVKDLAPLSFKESAVFRFVNHLQQALEKEHKVDQFEGASFLYRWFKSMDLEFPDIIEIKEESLIDYLKKKEISESSEAFTFFNLFKPESYKNFVEANKSEIIAWIKRKTGSLTIEDAGDEVHINYLLDNNADRINENSVFRINIVRAFLPYYKRYCTEAIVLPFPNEATVRVAREMSKKTIEPKNLGDEFNIHINKIWAKVILDQYAATSAYQWQKVHFGMRLQVIELSRKCTRLLEAKLENNVHKFNQIAKEVDRLVKDFFDMDAKRPKYPAQSKKYFEQEPFEREEKEISEFRNPFRNFVNQFYGLVAVKSDKDLRLPVVNIKDAVSHITSMQSAYDKIISSSHRYFLIDEVKKEESLAISRIADTASFFAAYFGEKRNERIVLADKAVREWKEHEERQLLNIVQSQVSACQGDITWDFILPTKILEIGNLRYVTIGLKDFDLSSDQDIGLLSVALKDLGSSGIHFFNFVVTDASEDITGAFRVSYRYLEQIREKLEGQISEDDLSIPLPIDLDEPTVLIPSSFKRKQIQINEHQIYYKMMFNCWKLREFRDRLDPFNSIELNWSIEIEQEFSEAIRSDFAKLPRDYEGEPSDSTITRFLNSEIQFSNQEIVGMMTEYALTIHARG